VKLQRQFKIIFLTSLAICFLSGVLWWIFENGVRVSGALGEEHHPAQIWFIRIHSTFAFILLINLGYLIKVHIEPGLKKKKKKRSGLSMVSIFTILILTALPILYATEGLLRSTSSFTHTYLGFALPLFLGLHLIPKKIA
jgi:hypothetical protein